MTPKSGTAYGSRASRGPHTTLEERPGGQCTARAKSTGERCGSYPVKGATVCRVHGGAAVQVREAAKRRLATEAVEAEVKATLAFEALEGVEDPLEALSLLASEALAMKESLAARVNSLKSIRYSAHGSGTEQLRAEVALYERAMDRAAKFLDLLAKSGFEERRVRLAEQQGQLVALALRRIFARLNLSAEQQALLPVVVPEELRRIDSESTVRGEVVKR